MRVIGRLVLCGSKVLQQLTQATCLGALEKILERRVISRYEDIYWSRGSPCQTTGPNHTGFFPFGYLDDKVVNISRNPHAVN